MPQVRIKLSKRPKQNGLHSVTVYISNKGSRAEFATGIEVKKEKDITTSQNKILDYHISRAKHLMYERPFIHAREVVTHLLGENTHETLYAFWEKEIKELESEGRIGTAKAYNQTFLGSLTSVGLFYLE